jgi:hypothetical protein
VDNSGASTLVTSLTTPLIVGGTTTTSPLTFKTTSGVGTTGADMHFLVGNNGATEAMTILNNGNVGIGIASPATSLHVHYSGSAGTSSQKGIYTQNLDDAGYASLQMRAGNGGVLYQVLYGTNGAIPNLCGWSHPSTVGFTFDQKVNIGTFAAGKGMLTIPVAPTASANYGLVSLGSGAFNGATAGFFTGAAAGTLIAGNAASGSTSDLMNLQVGGVSRIKTTASGTTTINGDITVNGTTYTHYDLGFVLTANVGQVVRTAEGKASGHGVGYFGAASYAQGHVFGLFYGNQYDHTSGTKYGIQNLIGFAPTSGTGVLNNTLIAPTINQTGGANGITRGLYINPTLTAAADFRGIEVANGSVSFPYRAVTATYAILNNDYTIDCTSGTFTVTLPTAVGCSGRLYNIVNSGEGTITIATTSSQVIGNGVSGILSETTTKTLNAGEVLNLQSTNAKWRVIA